MHATSKSNEHQQARRVPTHPRIVEPDSQFEQFVNKMYRVQTPDPTSV